MKKNETSIIPFEIWGYEDIKSKRDIYKDLLVGRVKHKPNFINRVITKFR